MKKLWLLLVLLSLNTFANTPSANCVENAKAAALALESINSGVIESKIKVVEHKYLGQIMIATGYLYKFETSLQAGKKSDKRFYQSYLFDDTCKIKEIVQVEPFIYK